MTGAADLLATVVLTVLALGGVVMIGDWCIRHWKFSAFVAAIAGLGAGFWFGYGPEIAIVAGVLAMAALAKAVWDDIPEWTEYWTQRRGRLRSERAKRFGEWKLGLEDERWRPGGR